MTLFCAPSAARAASTNGQIVAVGSNPMRLVTIDPDGRGLRTLVAAAPNETLSDPAWSPDGNQIAYASQEPDWGSRIKVFDMTTGISRPVTEHTDANEFDVDPGWTGDGSRVLFRRGPRFQSSDTTPYAMMRVAPDGSGLERYSNITFPRTTLHAAWSPDGTVAYSDELTTWYSKLDGTTNYSVMWFTTSQPSWSSDGNIIAVARDGVLLMVRDGLGWKVHQMVQSGARVHSPDISPDIKQHVYAQTNDAGANELKIAVHEGPRFLPLLKADGDSFTQPDWQPCVANVTKSCNSYSPAQPLKCADATAVVVSGRSTLSSELCPGAEKLVLVDAPKHAKTAIATGGRLTVVPDAGYAGDDVLYFRGVRGDSVSNVAQLTLKVVKPVAPKLSSVGRPKLDRRGRAVFKARCDQSCTVAVQLVSKLTTGRTIKGKLRKASVAAGGQIKLTLRRGATPKNRRVRNVWIRGTVTGQDGLQTAISIAVRR
jgi:Tol biopolymer transport system component